MENNNYPDRLVQELNSKLEQSQARIEQLEKEKQILQIDLGVQDSRIAELEKSVHDFELGIAWAKIDVANKDEEITRLREALEYAKGQLQHAGYIKNAVPVIDRALKGGE